MISAPTPANEAARLEALRAYSVLDTVCEASYDNVAEMAAELTSSPIALVSLVDANRQWFKSHIGLSVRETPREVSFCAHAILNPTEILVVPDARLDPRFGDNPLVTGELGLRFYAGVPLVSRSGMALGTLCVIDRKPRSLTPAQCKVLERLAESIMTTLELRMALAQIHQIAVLDYLTGLLNRAAMTESIGRSIERQRLQGDCFNLIYIDLDGMKAVNDRAGHAAGDGVLREAATILRVATGSGDTAARLGGDEFAILIAGDADRGILAASRFRLQIKARMEGLGWAVTASIGAVHFAAPPDSSDDALAAADKLMYISKTSGKDRITCSIQGSPAASVQPIHYQAPVKIRGCLA